MTRTLSRVSGLALVVALMVNGPALAEDELSTLAASWDEAFNSGDASGVAAMYAEDATVITGDGTVKNGPEEIEGLFQSFIDSGFKEHQIDVSNAEVNGDVGYMTGTWKGVGGDGNEYGGHLANVYERQEDGSWKTVVHIWN